MIIFGDQLRRARRLDGAGCGVHCFFDGFWAGPEVSSRIPDRRSFLQRPCNGGVCQRVRCSPRQSGIKVCLGKCSLDIIHGSAVILDCPCRAQVSPSAQVCGEVLWDRRGRFARVGHAFICAHLAPSLPAVVEGLGGTVFLRRIAPAQAIAIDEDYAAQSAPPLGYAKHHLPGNGSSAHGRPWLFGKNG